MRHWTREIKTYLIHFFKYSFSLWVHKLLACFLTLQSGTDFITFRFKRKSVGVIGWVFEKRGKRKKRKRGGEEREEKIRKGGRHSWSGNREAQSSRWDNYLLFNLKIPWVVGIMPQKKLSSIAIWKIVIFIPFLSSLGGINWPGDDSPNIKLNEYCMPMRAKEWWQMMLRMLLHD